MGDELNTVILKPINRFTFFNIILIGFGSILWFILSNENSEIPVYLLNSSLSYSVNIGLLSYGYVFTIVGGGGTCGMAIVVLSLVLRDKDLNTYKSKRMVTDLSIGGIQLLIGICILNFLH